MSQNRFNQNRFKRKTFKKPEEMKTKTGTSLKNYCYWLLARRDYGRQELIDRLNRYAADEAEVIQLVDELETNKYVDDGRVANSMLNSEIYKGNGPRKIQQAFQKKKVDMELVEEKLDEIDWFQQAYDLKVKKFGEKVATDQKDKAKQIRFLQYRGFSLDLIFKVVGHIPEDF